MGYRQSNAAYAYDMQPVSTSAEQLAPRYQERPELHVVSGEGLQANQAVSPAFFHVLKVFCMLAMLFVTVGVARIAIAGATASALNANAELTQTLEAGRDESTNLEVMRSVFSSPTRIRDIATATFGMVDSDKSVTVDLAGSAEAEPEASVDADADAAVR